MLIAGRYGYYWKTSEAEKNLLRTHTTAVSSRMLYWLAQTQRDGFKPAKYFSIDRVFRNEAIDRTHLAEFHQIEGAPRLPRCIGSYNQRDIWKCLDGQAVDGALCNITARGKAGSGLMADCVLEAAASGQNCQYCSYNTTGHLCHCAREFRELVSVSG